MMTGGCQTSKLREMRMLPRRWKSTITMPNAAISWKDIGSSTRSQTPAPSHLLSAFSSAVNFIGRSQEIRYLESWRDGQREQAVQVIYGPGGQGKTRLADEFARRCNHDGWDIIRATLVGGSESSIRQTDVEHSKAGLLVVVDYADQWTLLDLISMLNDAHLRNQQRLRVLMLARGTEWWIALRQSLIDRRFVVQEKLWRHSQPLFPTGGSCLYQRGTALPLPIALATDTNLRPLTTYAMTGSPWR